MLVSAIVTLQGIVEMGVTALKTTVAHAYRAWSDRESKMAMGGVGLYGDLVRPIPQNAA